jgi:hypothetical protein
MLDLLSLGGARCAEVGVFEGDFSAEILKRSPERLYLVDPWDHQDTKIYPDDHANLPSAEFDGVYQSVKKRFEGDERVSLVRGYSYFASEGFLDGSLDFVYVDAVHTFESCLCDLLTWYHKVKPGGWLCGHDFTGKYVGVKMAVDAFCRISGTEVSLVTLEPWASYGICKDK